MSPDLARALATAARGLADVADALAKKAEAGDSEAMLSEHDAARLAGLSVGVLRQARRTGDLAFYGGQRSRTVKRADLLSWIEARRAPVVRDVIAEDDAGIERRVDELARKRRRAS